MQAEPELSIIVPVYNVEKWLPYALESCLWQTESRIEVVVVNDGSTDSSADILAMYEKTDSRVRVYHQENKGVGVARQLGQQMSRGRYLLWLDADDFLDRRAAADMLAVANRDKVDMVCGNAVVFSDKTFNTRRYFYHPEVARTTFDNPRYWKSKVAWRWIVNAQFANNAGIKHPNYKLGQDVVVMYALLARVGTFSQCPAFMYYFRQEHKGIAFSLEAEIEHQLAHYIDVRDILLQAGRVKPLLKYLSENYVRDVKKLMPLIHNKEAHWEQRVEQLSLQLFEGLSPEWLEASFTEPEVPFNKELQVFGQALIAGDMEAVRSQLAGWSHIAPHSVNKVNAWHTFRRRIKAMVAPLSIKARCRQAELKALARKRLGKALIV